MKIQSWYRADLRRHGSLALAASPDSFTSPPAAARKDPDAFKGKWRRLSVEKLDRVARQAPRRFRGNVRPVLARNSIPYRRLKLTLPRRRDISA